MHDCGSFKGLLDGELSPDEARQVNQHLTRCAACRDEYEQLCETSGKLAAISFQEPEDAVLAQVGKPPDRWRQGLQGHCRGTRRKLRN